MENHHTLLLVGLPHTIIDKVQIIECLHSFIDAIQNFYFIYKVLSYYRDMVNLNLRVFFFIIFEY